MELPPHIISKILFGLDLRDFPTLVSIRCSSKQLCFLLDETLTLRGDDINFDRDKRRRAAFKSWETGVWKVPEYSYKFFQLEEGYVSVFTDLDKVVCYDAVYKIMGKWALAFQNEKGWYYIRILSRNFNVRSIHITTGSQEVEEDRANYEAFLGSLTTWGLTELSLPIYGPLGPISRLLARSCCWDGLMHLNVSRPEKLRSPDPDWDCGFAELLTNLPNLTFLAARNTSTGVRSWMALAETNGSALEHIDMRGCKAVGIAQSVGTGTFVSGLRRMTNLQNLLIGGTNMVGFFTDMDHDRDAKSVISNLGGLDISEPLLDGVTTEALLDTIELLLRTAARLRSFSSTGLQKLAGSERLLHERLGGNASAFGYGQDVADKQCTDQKLACSLLHLSVSWGFNSALLRVFVRSSSFLTTLSIGLGAQINNADLEAVAMHCPHLQRLILRFAMVSDTGVCSVIKACRSLTVLHLLRCSGPFGDALGGAFRSRRPLLLLRELHIVDGAQGVTDGGLARCLARTHAELQSLELVRCSALTASTFATIVQHARTLQHLTLADSCRDTSAAGRVAFQSIEMCWRLCSLVLRHCFIGVPALPQLQSLQDSCRMLKEVRLDICDLLYDPSPRIFTYTRNLRKVGGWSNALRYIELQSCEKPAWEARVQFEPEEGDKPTREGKVQRWDLMRETTSVWDWKEQAWKP